MPVFDANDAECLVFTRKDGLLSRVAHDLVLRVTSFSVEVSPDLDALTASFDPRSIRVVNATKGGREDPTALSERDRRTIEDNLVRDVLHPDRHPEIRFEARELARTRDGLRVAGALTLHGVTRPVQAVAREDDGRLVAEVVLHQPDFGITPYTAMLGALKVQADVRVRLSFPMP